MGTLLRFLVGDRGAILRLASDRNTVWTGLLFVLAAGLAREYDGVDLAREPWWLLVPPAASLAVSILLFAAIYVRIGPDRPGAAGVGFWPAYRAFLGLFWMTAPLALLYAIPYERFLSPGDATRANLWTLAVVALWRVVLITRVLSVLTGRGMGSIFLVVMLLADVVLMAAVVAAPKPILDIMGGVRLTERESLLQSTSFLVTAAAVLMLPIWLLGAAFVLFRGRMGWNVPAPTPATDARRGRGLILLAAASVAALALLLPFTQPEQRRRTRVERDMNAGRVAEALATMSAHAPGDFPPQWDPPPRPAYDWADRPALLDVLEVIADRGAADWVRGVYVDKLERTYLSSYRSVYNLEYGDAAAHTWSRVERLLDRLPEGPALRREHADVIEDARDFIGRMQDDDEDAGEEGDGDGEPATRPATRATTRATTKPATLPATGPAEAAP